MSVNDRLDQLEKTINDLKTVMIKTDDKIKEYLKTLEPKYHENKNFSEEFIFGKSLPHNTPSGKTISIECCHETDGTPWPHLFHTMHPQLNNISDMLATLLQCSCHKKQESEEKQLIEELTDKKEQFSKLIEELEENKNKKKNIDIHIRDLTDSLKKLSDYQEERRCITIEDLKKLLHKEQHSSEVVPFGNTPWQKRR